jgi:hypothetical protein
LCSCLHSLITSSLVGPTFFLGTLFSDILSLRSSLRVRETMFHIHTKQKSKTVVFYISILTFLDSKLEDARFCTEWQHSVPYVTLLLILPEENFDSLRLFPNIWTVPPLQSNYEYYESLYCDFVLHSDLETWPCT